MPRKPEQTIRRLDRPLKFCHWPLRGGLGHCDAVAVQFFEEDLGYCGEHYHAVLELRRWIFWSTQPLGGDE